MSVIDKYKDMGTIVMGKSEAGIVRKGDRLYVMPNKCARARTPPAAPRRPTRAPANEM
jgi:translation elongation factor EF-1alpha